MVVGPGVVVWWQWVVLGGIGVVVGGGWWWVMPGGPGGGQSVTSGQWSWIFIDDAMSDGEVDLGCGGWCHPITRLDVRCSSPVARLPGVR